MREESARGSLIQGDYKSSLNPRIFKRHPFQSKVLRWSDLGPFGPVWLCLIEVEKERGGTRDQEQKQEQIQVGKQNKEKGRGSQWGGKRCEIYKGAKSREKEDYYRDIRWPPRGSRRTIIKQKGQRALVEKEIRLNAERGKFN